MSRKLILGVGLPLIIIVVITWLSVTNTDFSMEKETIKQVAFEDLFTNKTYPMPTTTVQTIHLQNDFFMPTRFKLVPLTVCLNDKEDKLQKQSLYVRYSEGSSNLPGELISDLLLPGAPAEKSVEIPANGKKSIKIMVESRSLYNNEEEMYSGYDELLLIEVKEKQGRFAYLGHNDCYNVDGEQMANAVRIPIVA